MNGYAPVATFALAVEDARITGYAAPAAGPRPCLLGLEADGEPIAIAAASRYSAGAAARGLRLGWCGVVLDGLGPAAALADRARVVCMESGAVLLEADIPPPPSDTPAPITVERLLAEAACGETCDAEALRPFAAATLSDSGFPRLIDAVYRSLLHRRPEAQAVETWRPILARPDPVDALLAIFLGSPEHGLRPRPFIPGPFHPDFAFDLAPLDAPPG